MTATTLHTSPTATNIFLNNALGLPTLLLHQSWTCNTCGLLFDNGQAQREHMKSSWHVYNLKRRIALLPPVSSDTFRDKIQMKPEPIKGKSRKDYVENTDHDTISPYKCLFCQVEFANDTDGLKNTLEHMSTFHGLFIPNQAMLSDLESFLGYLATEVRVWHECLYCGTSRASTIAVQSHMRDSGHCMLNLEREPELMGFWERSSDMEGSAVNTIARSETGHASKLQLLSGRAVSSRWFPRRRIQSTRALHLRRVLRTEFDPPQSPEPFNHRSYRQLARRDEMGIQSINSQQRHALILAQERSQRSEAIATRAKEWSSSRKANDQKHDQAYGPLSWAKAGAHNLLPR